MTLQEIYLSVKGDKPFPDKGSEHSYIEYYEEILVPYRTKAKNILEIGIFDGGSLRMWERYFCGKVYGIDCSETPHDGMADLRPMIAEGTHNIIICDATNVGEVEKHFGGMKFDVIIEDAAHQLSQQFDIYNVFKNHIAENGIYIIEDVENIDESRIFFENIDSKKTVEIIDRRSVKGRFDDVIVLIK